MQRPTVTIGVPVRNGQGYLASALAALLSQTFDDFELLVADNASTDGTAELCRSVADADQRVRVLRSEENHGLSWNWNRLVVVARGRYFRWACYDDLVEASLLERCVAQLDAAGADVAAVYPRTMEIDEAGGRLGLYRDDLDLGNPQPHRRLSELLRHLRRCNQMFSVFRTEVLRSTRLLGRYGHPDHVLLAEVALRGRLLELPEPLFLRRIHPLNSLTAHRTFGDLARLHDPTLSQRYFYPNSRLYAEHVRAIVQARLGAAETARCIAMLVRDWPRYRSIAGEVKLNLQDAVRERRAVGPGGDA
jgi:glycosyltransferase involved in cell wall biosynthesis